MVVDLDQPMMTPEQMAQHFTNDRMVILRGVMLSGINRIIDWGDRFVVFDRQGQQVAVFDTTGNCIRQIKRLGKGPGEYIQLDDCTIDNANDELILYADMPGKLIWFDRDGNYLREERISDCFQELLCAGDHLYGVNCGPGTMMAKQSITRMVTKDKAATKEQQLSYGDNIPNSNSGLWLTSNGSEVWLSRPFDYTLYSLDRQAKQFVPRYQLDLGKSALPENEIKQKMDLMEIHKKRFVFHVPRVNTVGRYLILSSMRGNAILIDTVSNQVMKLGKTHLLGSTNLAVGGCRLLENQNKRIVHAISLMTLQMWSEEIKNKGETNAELEAVVAANEEFMNPVLLFQDVI